MNKYPLWKYLLIAAVIVPGLVYFLPNLYGEDPAIQVAPSRAAPVDQATRERVEAALTGAGLPYDAVTLSETGIKVRFPDTETQLKARELVQWKLGDDYTVALNLLPATPAWLGWFNARPMYLGLDLRGGVHFLMQVDMDAAIKKAEERYVEDLRSTLREKKVRYLTVVRRDQGGLEIRFREAEQRDNGRAAIEDALRELTLTEAERRDEFLLIANLSEPALAEKRKFAIEQNMTSLRNRVNELGVAEPVIQQQGADRIIVQLPGVQDTGEAKRILGRTATLEIMLVDEEHSVEAAVGGTAPAGSKLYRDRQGRPILLKRQLIYSGDNIVDAAAGFDSQGGGAVVHITLDARGAAVNQRITGENVGKRMAVVYIEVRSTVRRGPDGTPLTDAQGEVIRDRQNIEEVITAPVIREQLGKRFQISGLDSINEARELALLLRAGALAAPIDIIEERTVGPSLGADNIRQGFNSTLIGFAAIAIFMMVYYRFFGLVANVALAANMVLLVALMSLLQATLTLPGIAGIALTLGMAIDANVLIHERIREELRNGNTPQAAIHAGYDRALGTIVDSNLTTLIAGFALFFLGSGPVRGFAVTLCLGIFTSMFSAILVSRAVVNLTYGRRRKLERLSI
ncbi:MAG TPA: protein translocase subunit SecD [Acidiferrobacterales bacterium]